MCRSAASSGIHAARAHDPLGLGAYLVCPTRRRTWSSACRRSSNIHISPGTTFPTLGARRSRQPSRPGRPAAAQPLDREHDLGGRGERVAAGVHRQRPRRDPSRRWSVILARVCPAIGRDDPDGKPFQLEHGSLLYVDLDVAGELEAPASVAAVSGSPPAVRIASRSVIPAPSTRSSHARSNPPV